MENKNNYAPKKYRKPLISVLIATKNRPDHLKRCLGSILQNNFSLYEIIVVDQSHNNSSKRVIQSLNSHHIQHIKTNSCGKANALNIGLKRAAGDIISFTDDDCIVHKLWLNSLSGWLIKHPSVGGVFGPSFPFNKEKNVGKVCATPFFMKREHLVDDPYIIHYKKLGLGNNMSLRRKVIQQVGNFTPWLGPGKNFGGDDSDYIFRTLLQGHRLGYSPKIIVYHNKWLTPKEEELLQCGYTRGAIAFSFYHMLNNHQPLHVYIEDRIKDGVVAKVQKLTELLVKLRLKQVYTQKREILYLAYELLNILWGISIATIAYVKKKGPRINLTYPSTPC